MKVNEEKWSENVKIRNRRVQVIVTMNDEEKIAIMTSQYNEQ